MSVNMTLLSNGKIRLRMAKTHKLKKSTSTIYDFTSELSRNETENTMFEILHYKNINDIATR